MILKIKSGWRIDRLTLIAAISSVCISSCLILSTSPTRRLAESDHDGQHQEEEFVRYSHVVVWIVLKIVMFASVTSNRELSFS